MKCVYCGTIDSKVIDSRLNEEGTAIRRRRECAVCGKRFTTYETIETSPVMVVKKTGARQVYNPQKVREGLIKACEKRPVAMYQIEKIVDEISRAVANCLDGEITSSQIGEMVMEKLKQVDDVAYVRFAAIYRQFKDINSWLSEIEGVLREKNKGADSSEKH